MNDEFHDIENRLGAMRPTTPDAALLDRLEAAAHGTLPALTPEEARFEAQLGAYEPMALSPDFLFSLERVVAATPFPVDEKIVLFTKASSAPAPARRYRPWAAAAAVALLGAMTALMMPGGLKPTATQEPVAGNPVPRIPTRPFTDRVAEATYKPQGYGRNVQEAKDEGIVWQNGKPHRVVRMVYKDLVTFTNAEGKKVEVEQPRVEYILVPEKID